MVDPKEPPPPPGVVFSPHPRPEQFEEVILRANPEGEIVRLRDVGKIEADAEPGSVLSEGDS
jgi:multidrug efflux pump subunit AcrB